MRNLATVTLLGCLVFCQVRVYGEDFQNAPNGTVLRSSRWQNLMVVNGKIWGKSRDGVPRPISIWPMNETMVMPFFSQVSSDQGNLATWGQLISAYAYANSRKVAGDPEDSRFLAAFRVTDPTGQKTIQKIRNWVTGQTQQRSIRPEPYNVAVSFAHQDQPVSLQPGLNSGGGCSCGAATGGSCQPNFGCNNSSLNCPNGQCASQTIAYRSRTSGSGKLRSQRSSRWSYQGDPTGNLKSRGLARPWLGQGW